MSQALNLSSIAIVTELVAEMNQLFESDFADAKGEVGLKMVEKIEVELTLVADAVAVQLKAAGARAAVLRAEVQDEAVARVVMLLNSGSISLADITARMSGAVVAVPAEIIAAPAEAVVALPVVIEAVEAVEAVEVVAVTPVAEVAPPAVEVVATEVAAVVEVAAPATSVVGIVIPTQSLTAPYKNPVKFLDPVSGAGWSGRGPVPKWFADLLVNGKTKEDFRVVAQVATITEAAAAVQTETPAAEAVAAAPKAEAITPAATTVASDIGAHVSFDADFSFDDVQAPAKRDDDIGEFIAEFASMAIVPPVAQLMAA